MALRYNIHEVKNARLPEDEKQYSITLVRSSNVTLNEIAGQMNELSAFSHGDVTGLITNLIGVIANHLALGNTVTLDGLGTFSVSAGLKRPVTNPETVTGNDIEIKKIYFRPSPGFKTAVEEKASFLRFVPVKTRKE